MGNARKTIPNSGGSTTGVDFIAIYQSVFSTLQAIRSNDGIFPGHLVLRADETGAAENGESMLNAFYRSIGLPAIRDDAKITAQMVAEGGERSDITQNDTINYMSALQIGLPGGPAEVEARESNLSQLNSTKSGAITEDSLIDGLLFMSQPGSVTSGVDDQTRPSLIPMVVAGDVTVFPVSRRVCPLFYPGDFQDGNGVAPRAFLESVIYNILFKTDDTPAAKELRASIALQTGDSAAETELSSKNILVLQFLQKAYTALLGAATQYAQAVMVTGVLSAQTSYFPALKRSGPAVKQGYFDIQYSEAKEKLKNNEMGKTLLSRIKEPELDSLIRRQSAEVAKLDNFYNMLPYNIINEESRIMQIADGTASNRPAINLFADIVVGIATIDGEKKRQSLANLVEQQRVLRNNLETIRSSLEVFTGTTTGISIFDILAIFISLYLLEPNHLIGLLNDAAIERLREKGTSTAFSGIGLSESIDGRASTAESLIRLEQLVIEQLELAQSFFKKASGNTK
jgi:hypothetical protein